MKIDIEKIDIRMNNYINSNVISRRYIYLHLNVDDSNWGHDNNNTTRIASLSLFTIGLYLQLVGSKISESGSRESRGSGRVGVVSNGGNFDNG